MDESDLATTSAGIPLKGKPRLTWWVGVALLVCLAPEAVLVYARFGNPKNMPEPMERLAIKLGNPRTLHSLITPDWAFLCRAWATWLWPLQNNAPRLLRTTDLWAPDDPLKAEMANFLATANELRPGTLVPEAAAEKRLEVLAGSPPDLAVQELLTNRVASKVERAWSRVLPLAIKLEKWPRWTELRQLLEYLQARGFTKAAAALRPRLPPQPDAPGYKVNTVRTLKLFNDVSLDDAGMLRLASRWSEFTRLAKAMEASGDPVTKARPGQALARLVDQASLAELADSLVAPLEELRR